MVIKINPRISGDFVRFVMRNPSVNKLIEHLPESEAHGIVKAVIITAMTHFDININEVINMIKDSNDPPKKSLRHGTQESFE